MVGSGTHHREERSQIGSRVCPLTVRCGPCRQTGLMEGNAESWTTAAASPAPLASNLRPTLPHADDPTGKFRARIAAWWEENGYQKKRACAEHPEGNRMMPGIAAVVTRREESRFTAWMAQGEPKPGIATGRDVLSG